ncbi:glutathione S-transferase A4-like [Patiria miniata]|uniref:Glutathione transferase n=1 Tax=Patiria miniata TaxID=46514 RepID=A0A913YXL6_PATMI|nr:glutathione S-transferase A4-like [Patiria miniata]
MACMVSEVNFLVDLLQNTMASKTKLVYFKGRGKGELIRLTLAAAGVEFDDVFLTEPEQLEKLREDGDLLFMQVPLLEIDGLKLVQSGAIIRYLAHKHNMMGKTPEEQAMVDMLFEGSRDFINLGFGSVVFKATEEEKQQTLDLIKSKAKGRYLPIFEKVYKKSTSGFLVGDSLTLADIAWLEVLLWLHEIEPQFAISFPGVAAFTNKISSLPNVSAFLYGPQRQPQPDEIYVTTVRKVLNWY